MVELRIKDTVQIEDVNKALLQAKKCVTEITKLALKFQTKLHLLLVSFVIKKV